MLDLKGHFSWKTREEWRPWCWPTSFTRPSLKAQGKCWWAKCPGAFGGGGGGNPWKSKKLAGMDRRHDDISFVFWKLSLSKQKCARPFAEFAWKKWQLNMWRQKPLVSAPQYCLHLARVCIRVSAQLWWRLTTCFANQWLSQHFFSQVESYILFPRQQIISKLLLALKTLQFT